MEEIKNAYQQKPDVVALTHVHDVKAWLGDHVPSIHDHTSSNCRKITKGLSNYFIKNGLPTIIGFLHLECIF